MLATVGRQRGRRGWRSSFLGLSFRTRCLLRGLSVLWRGEFHSGVSTPRPFFLFCSVCLFSSPRCRRDRKKKTVCVLRGSRLETLSLSLQLAALLSSSSSSSSFITKHAPSRFLLSASALSSQDGFSFCRLQVFFSLSPLLSSSLSLSRSIQRPSTSSSERGFPCFYFFFSISLSSPSMCCSLLSFLFLLASASSLHQDLGSLLHSEAAVKNHLSKELQLKTASAACASLISHARASQTNPSKFSPKPLDRGAAGYKRKRRKRKKPKFSLCRIDHLTRSCLLIRAKSGDLRLSS